jgi:hypothetical protein
MEREASASERKPQQAIGVEEAGFIRGMDSHLRRQFLILGP